MTSAGEVKEYRQSISGIHQLTVFLSVYLLYYTSYNMSIHFGNLFFAEKGNASRVKPFPKNVILITN